MPVTHRIAIEPEHRSLTSTVYSYRCSCGAYSYGYKSRGEAERYGREHQEQAALRP